MRISIIILTKWYSISTCSINYFCCYIYNPNSCFIWTKTNFFTLIILIWTIIYYTLNIMRVSSTTTSCIWICKASNISRNCWCINIYYVKSAWTACFRTYSVSISCILVYENIVCFWNPVYKKVSWYVSVVPL